MQINHKFNKLKIFSLILPLVLLLPMFTACNFGSNDSAQIDSTKTQLNIGVFNDGTGVYWLEEMAKDFENLYAETSFEEGKTGVEIKIDPQKDRFKSETLTATMKSTANNGNTLYIVPTAQATFLNENLIVDITDTVREKIYDDNGDLAIISGNQATKNIIDFMYPEYLDIVKVNNKYYSVPWRTYFWGITYDADLFDEEKLFIKANGQVGANKNDINNQNCSTGPDGIYGTSDDGMPNDWTTFVVLLTKMKDKNIVPFTWSFEQSYQRRGFFDAIWANYEGANDFTLNYSFNGTDSQFGAIDDSNFWQLISQEGRKAAIKAAYDVTSNSNFYSSRVKSNNYTDAQYEFVHSIVDSNRIAMLLEGSYWEAEAKSTFDDMAIFNPGFGYGKRDFRWLPIPNFIDVEGIIDQDITRKNASDKYDRVLQGSSASTSGFYISKQNKFSKEKYDKQVEIAKLFIQFAHSRQQLANYTKNSGGSFRPFNFVVSDTELEAWPGVAKSIYDFIQEGATIVNEMNNGAFRNNNISAFAEGAWSFNHGDWKDPLAYFLDHHEDSVQGCFNYSKQMLESVYKK